MNHTYIPAMTWTYRAIEPFAYALVRISIGLIIACEGLARITGSNPALSLTGAISALPPTVVAISQIVGGLLVAAGLWTRLAAAIMAVLWLLASLGYPPGGGRGVWLMMGI